MDIRMTQTVAGPDGPYVEGVTYRVPAEMAEDAATVFVDVGSAEWAEAEDLSGLTKDELAALAEAREVEVARADGKDGEPLKSDYIRALA